MIRRWIYWVLIAAFVWLVASRFHEFKELTQLFTQGQLQWLMAALGLQLVHYLVSSASFRSAFATVGVETRLRDLFPLLFGVTFVNVVAPTGGVSGAALFVDHAVRRGQSSARTAAGVVLQLITSMLAFMVVLIAGLVYLGVQQRLLSYHIFGSLILLLAIVLISAAMALAMWRPELLRALLWRMQRLVNGLGSKVKRATLISDEWVEKHIGDFLEAGAAILARPSGMARTVLIILVAHILNIAVLYTLFLAFREMIPIGPLVAGYAIGILFLIVSVTPQGIGVVEGVMPLVFGSLGVPDSIALLTVLTFRGLSFWLPLLLGFIILRRLDVFRTVKETLKT